MKYVLDGSSPFRSTLNTGYITALDMCEVCTEAVHHPNFEDSIRVFVGFVSNLEKTPDVGLNLKNIWMWLFGLWDP